MARMVIRAVFFTHYPKNCKFWAFISLKCIKNNVTGASYVAFWKQNRYILKK